MLCYLKILWMTLLASRISQIFGLKEKHKGKEMRKEKINKMMIYSTINIKNKKLKEEEILKRNLLMLVTATSMKKV